MESPAPVAPNKTVFLVGVDGSAESIIAVEQAFRLAKGEHDLVYLMACTPKGSKDEARYLEDIGAPKVKVPRTFKGQVERRVEEGDARMVLCAEAKALGADYVVVGNRGMGPIKSALVGSVSDYIVKHAPCSVIVVRV